MTEQHEGWVVVRYDSDGVADEADLPDDDSLIEMWRYNGIEWFGMRGRIRRLPNGTAQAYGDSSTWRVPPDDVPYPSVTFGVVWRCVP